MPPRRPNRRSRAQPIQSSHIPPLGRGTAISGETQAAGSTHRAAVHGSPHIASHESRPPPRTPSPPHAAIKEHKLTRQLGPPRVAEARSSRRFATARHARRGLPTSGTLAHSKNGVNPRGSFAASHHTSLQAPVRSRLADVAHAKLSGKAFISAVSSPLAPPFRWHPAHRVLLPLPPLDDQSSWPTRPRFRGPLAARKRLESAAGRPETVVEVPSLPGSLFNTNALRDEQRWSTKRAPPNQQQ